jgi:hypothetical protein
MMLSAMNPSTTWVSGRLFHVGSISGNTSRKTLSVDGRIRDLANVSNDVFSMAHILKLPTCFKIETYQKNMN